jgi:protein gp37
MTGRTSIAWADLSWNVLAGCSRVSPGCDNCYAFALHDRRHDFYVRHGGVYPKNGKPIPRQYAKPFSEVQLLPDRLQDPLHIKTPSRFFVNSMADLFHSEVPFEFIKQVFEVMRQAHWHTFQILTKRPNRVRYLASALDWAPNVWLGTSIESDAFCRRADLLCLIPAAVRFLSLEPLLGPLPSLNLDSIHWVIVGGESGPDARPIAKEWVVDIRDRCVEAGIPFFLKQWGGRTPNAGGSLLDGRDWKEFPRTL